jgi:hypothetical protein
VKPLRARIREAAASTGIGEQVIEKDYALSYIVAGVAAQPELSESMIFKGGTALKKFFFGDYCFSEDREVCVQPKSVGRSCSGSAYSCGIHSMVISSLLIIVPLNLSLPR